MKLEYGVNPTSVHWMDLFTSIEKGIIRDVAHASLSKGDVSNDFMAAFDNFCSEESLRRVAFMQEANRLLGLLIANDMGIDVPADATQEDIALILMSEMKKVDD